MALRKYLLVKDNLDNPQEEVEKLVSLLKASAPLKVSKPNETTYQFSYDSPNNIPFSLEVTNTESTQGETRTTKPQIALTCDQIADNTVTLFKYITPKLGFRMFNFFGSIFIPKDTGLLEKPGVMNPKLEGVFKSKKFEPIYYFKNTLDFYAQSQEDSTVHMINPYLLRYYLDFGVDEKDNPEFSYQVAPNTRRFVAMFDNKLVPIFFYDYWQKPTKIINRSGLDIEKVDRKIFIKPTVYQLNDPNQSFDQVASENSALNFMDKIRSGENLDTAIKRILKDELKLADDYLGAYVARDLEFDRDKEGILTPRLLVNIFLEKAASSEEIKTLSQRSWVSPNKEI